MKIETSKLRNTNLVTAEHWRAELIVRTPEAASSKVSLMFETRQLGEWRFTVAYQGTLSIKAIRYGLTLLAPQEISDTVIHAAFAEADEQYPVES